MKFKNILGSSNRLTRRLIIYIVLASTLVTIFTSSFQLYEIYSADVLEINHRLNEISDTYVDTISSRLWVSNKGELRRDVNNLVRLPDISYVKIIENENIIVEAGDMPIDKFITKEYPLKYVFRGQLQKFGTLHVTASLSNAYQHVIDQALAIIISNALKTFLISGFMLILFYHLIAKHLQRIAEYAEGISIDSLGDILELDRSKNDSNKQDELDLVVDSFHLMQRNITDSISLLSKSEQNLAQTLNSIGDGVITTDDKGCVTRMNPIAEKLTAWRIEEARGKNLIEVFPIVNSLTRKPVVNPVEQVIGSGEIIGLANHTILLAKDGKEYQISDSAAPILDERKNITGVILVFRNVTDEYALQEEIKNNEQRLSAIMDNSPAVIYVKDLNGKFTSINKKFKKLLGLSEEEIIGKTTHDLFSKSIADNLVANDRDVLGSKLSLNSEEKVTLDDGVHIFSSDKFCLLNKDGVPYAVAGISTDITEKIKQNELLRQSKKMDALGKLTGGIAHDFNNILNVIIGYSEILRHKLAKDSSEQHFAKEIKEAGQRGASLTRKLLSFSGQSASSREKVNINDVLQEDINMLKKTLTARIHINIQLDEIVWAVMMDKGEFQNSILNLSINAMHAMPSGGTIIYQSLNERLSPEKAHQLGLPKAGDYVRFSLIDTGTGMDEETLSKVFDPFFTTKGENGTGLGLSQVFGFMESCGGVIKVHSEVGKGTDFSMYFPRAKLAEDVDAEEEKIFDGKYSGTETILLVDDEKALLTLGSEIFKEQGYKVLLAEAADSALWILSRNKVDVMVSDVIMPGTDGYDLARKVEQLYPEIKIQLVSGYSSERLGKEKDNPYTATIIDKPYSAEQILERVRSLIDTA